MATPVNPTRHQEKPRVHTDKKGLRVLGIAESFSKSNSKSVLCGVVMRRDLIVDGMTFGTATIQGDDATETITSMISMLHRQDINSIMIDGLVISMYNIVRGQEIAGKTNLPVIAVTFKESGGLEGAIRHHFPAEWESKLQQYMALGDRQKVMLKTGKPLFIRHWKIAMDKALSLLNSFTLQGSVPEPVRVAKVGAYAASKFLQF